MTTAIIILCGLVIALALYQFWRSLRKMTRGECCEGCEGCAVQDSCSSKPSGDRESD